MYDYLRAGLMLMVVVGVECSCSVLKHVPSEADSSPVHRYIVYRL